ncbi:MAG: Lrp/AsnC family transcriptional regulator, partial [Paracoccaceae bacterium]
LEADGYVRAYVARLSAQKLGLNVQGFIQVHLNLHAPETSTTFARLVRTRPEITSAWSMTGDADYLLRVFCEDLPALNRLIHDVLLPHEAVLRVHSQIVLDQLKEDSSLPI